MDLFDQLLIDQATRHGPIHDASYQGAFVIRHLHLKLE